MKNWDERDEIGHCNSEEDYHQVSEVCKALHIPHTQVNFVKEYWNEVFRFNFTETLNYVCAHALTHFTCTVKPLKKDTSLVRAHL